MYRRVIFVKNFDWFPYISTSGNHNINPYKLTTKLIHLKASSGERKITITTGYTPLKDCIFVIMCRWNRFLSQDCVRWTLYLYLYIIQYFCISRCISVYNFNFLGWVEMNYPTFPKTIKTELFILHKCSIFRHQSFISQLY